MIAFCVDASPTVGMGHLVRCRVLAQAFAQLGVPSLMYGPSEVYRTPADRTRFAAWMPRPTWTTSGADGATFAAFAGAHRASKAVVDDYRADACFQQALLDAEIIWLQQFDASCEHTFLGRFVVNASPYERPEYYRRASRDPAVRFLLGPRYAILRSEFNAIVPRDPDRRTNQVFLSFGGGNDRGAALGILAALVASAGAKTRFALISGPHNPNNKEIARHIAAQRWSNVDLQVGPPDIPALMLNSDIAVLGGGTTTYEAARCGLPMLIVAIADNQVRQAIGWEETGAAIYLGRWGETAPDTIASSYVALANDPVRAGRMALRGPEVVDCNGARRLANLLLKDIDE